MTKFFNLTASPLLFSFLQGSTWRSISLPALGSVAAEGSIVDSRGQLLLAQGRMAQYDGVGAVTNSPGQAQFGAADVERMVDRMLASPVVVGNQAARLALTVAQAAGKLVIQADQNTSWLLNEGGSPATLSHWVRIGRTEVNVADIVGLQATLATEAARQTALVAAVARNLAIEVDRSTSSAPENLITHPGPLYLTGVTSLVGGGTSDFDGITTAGMPEGAVRDVVIDNSASEWQLRVGFEATDVAAGIIRPVDFHVTTNPLNWIRLSAADRTQTSLDRAAVEAAVAAVEAAVAAVDIDVVAIDTAVGTATAASQTASDFADLAITAAAQSVAAANSISSFTHNQGTPSALWTINHNLGRYPSVTVVDSAGTFVIGELKYISSNQVTATFSAAFSGSAYLN